MRTWNSGWRGREHKGSQTDKAVEVRSKFTVCFFQQVLAGFQTAGYVCSSNPVVPDTSHVGLGSQGGLWQTRGFIYRANAWKNPMTRMEERLGVRDVNCAQKMKINSGESTQPSHDIRDRWDLQNTRQNRVTSTDQDLEEVVPKLGFFSDEQKNQLSRTCFNIRVPLTLGIRPPTVRSQAL